MVVAAVAACRSRVGSAGPVAEVLVLAPLLRPVERFIPAFEDPQPILLQDTVLTQCWSRGRALLFPRRDIGSDLRAVDSCSCWAVRGAVHQGILRGEQWTVADDSLLVAEWRKDGEGLVVCSRKDLPDLLARRYRMDVLDTVRELTEYIDRLDGTGMDEFHTVRFRMTEVH